MKKTIAAITAALMLFFAGCGAVSEETTEAVTAAQTTGTEETTAAHTEAETTAPEEKPALPDHYVDFRDGESIYGCSNLYHVTTEQTDNGMAVKFLSSDKEGDPTYCFDPYMTLPLPEGDFTVDEYPFFVIMLYTSRSDMQGDMRYKTDGLKDPNSYPTYRFSYDGEGEQKIILNFRSPSVMFIANGDSPVHGKYNDLRLDMFENSASTTDEYVIRCYAFFKTLSEARDFDGLPEPEKQSGGQNDLSAFYKGNEFSDPDNKYRPKKLLYGFEPGNYDFALKKLESNGYGGVVSNVRFNDAYLKDDSEFSLLSDAYRYGKTLGLHAWIYDEYQWPSGKAFGQVLEGHDEFEATGIELIKLYGSGDIKYTLPENYISIVGADLVDGKEKTKLETDGKTVDAKHNGKYTVYVYARRVTNQKKENPKDFSTLRDVDLLNYDAVTRFIETTYEKYREKTGGGFDVVEAFFTDEPQLGNRDMKSYVVWSDKLPEKFREMHGYEIEENLYSLYGGTTTHDRLVRVNFYQTVSEMFRVSYFEQIREWCEKNGKASSGHLLFEENIQRQIETYGGDFLRLTGEMSIPGGDILQIEPERLLTEGTDIGNFMGLKYVSSAAKNKGEYKVHLEFTPSAVAGAPFFSEPGKYTIAGATLASFFGANTYTVICGDNDVPAADLQKFTSYAGRIHTLLDTAFTTSEIGVFYPVDSVRAAYNADTEHFNYNGDDEAASVNRLMQHTCLEILKSGYDFTVLDDKGVSDSTLEGGKMKIGAGLYSVIVMPHVKVMSYEALEKLTEFKNAGGTVIWLDCLPKECTDARKAEAFKALADGIKDKKYTGKIGDALGKVCEIPFSAQVKSGVFVSEYKRTDDGKKILYLANSSKTVKSVWVGPEQTGEYHIYDPYDCTVTPASGKTQISIPAYRAILIVE